MECSRGGRADGRKLLTCTHHDVFGHACSNWTTGLQPQGSRRLALFYLVSEWLGARSLRRSPASRLATLNCRRDSLSHPDQALEGSPPHRWSSALHRDEDLFSNRVKVASSFADTHLALWTFSGMPSSLSLVSQAKHTAVPGSPGNEADAVALKTMRLVSLTKQRRPTAVGF